MTKGDIPGRMAGIRNIFEDALLTAKREDDDQALLAYLETTDFNFRSIAYEGASMARALTDFTKGDDLTRWNEFRQISPGHTVQVHVGLGWAASQSELPHTNFINQIAPLLQTRVLDGYGYYDGMFRHRNSIRDRALPTNITGSDLRGYDQGIGRSLWYYSKGNIDQLVKTLDGFANSRKYDLWRGIGIAVSYIGGYDNAMLESIYHEAASYKGQLTTGAVLLAKARIEAGTENDDLEMACRVWGRLSAADASDLAKKTEPQNPQSADDYFNWMAVIENALDLPDIKA